MLVNSVKQGVKKGLETTWFLAKVIIPIYIIITILEHTVIFGYIAKAFSPLMGYLNLPGEAAIVLVVGNFLSPYAAIAAIKALDLNVWQITNLATMIGISHALLMETAVIRELKVNTVKVNFLRIGISLAVGVVLGQLGGVIYD